MCACVRACVRSCVCVCVRACDDAAFFCLQFHESWRERKCSMCKCVDGRVKCGKICDILNCSQVSLAWMTLKAFSYIGIKQIYI